MATIAPTRASAAEAGARDIARFATTARWDSRLRTDVTARQFAIAVDEPPELGGADTAPNPMELLLAGLDGCLSVVVHTIAGELGATVRALDLASEATLDTRGFLGTAPVRPYFQTVHTAIEIGIDGLDEAGFASFRDAVAARCPAGTLIAAAGVDFTISWARV